MRMGAYLVKTTAQSREKAAVQKAKQPKMNRFLPIDFITVLEKFQLKINCSQN